MDHRRFPGRRVEASGQKLLCNAHATPRSRSEKKICPEEENAGRWRMNMPKVQASPTRQDRDGDSGVATSFGAPSEDSQMLTPDPSSAAAECRSFTITIGLCRFYRQSTVFLPGPHKPIRRSVIVELFHLSQARAASLTPSSPIVTSSLVCGPKPNEHVPSG